MASNIVGLNPSQVIILQTLAASRGLTIQELEKKVGPNVPCTPTNLGPAYKETLANNPALQGSLWGLGLVKPQYDEVDGKMVCLWHATGKGRIMADSLRAKPRASRESKIPPSIIDPIVKEFRKTRTYSFEAYTDEDILDIRDLLPYEYSEVTIDSLKFQIANRRKQGAFADPAKKIKSSVEKAIREFGPEGTIAQILTPEQIKEMQGLYLDVDGQIESTYESEDGE